MVLFMVDTSLSGVFRSGPRPRSAALRYWVISAGPTRPVKCDVVAQTPLRWDCALSALEAVAEPEQHHAQAGATTTVHQLVGHQQELVDVVLWTHDPQVGQQVVGIAADGRVGIDGAHPCRVGTAAHHGHL